MAIVGSSGLGAGYVKSFLEAGYALGLLGKSKLSHRRAFVTNADLKPNEQHDGTSKYDMCSKQRLRWSSHPSTAINSADAT